MLDPITLDQLRMLVTVVEAGSFSAAARKLGRVQSAVSTAMMNLEAQLEIALWDRRERSATLLPEGNAVLGVARRVLSEVDALRRVAAGLAEGLEVAVSLCVDAVFPLDALVEVCSGFAKEFPSVELRVDVQTMSAVAERVLDGVATLGVAASALAQTALLERRALASVRMVPVAAARHPLAKYKGRLSHARLTDHVQIVLSERAHQGMPDQGVLSTRTWRVLDLQTKRELLRAGLGWGNLPLHVARADLDRGRLVRLRLEGWADDEHTLHLVLVHRRDATLGPAHRWLADRLAAVCAKEAEA